MKCGATVGTNRSPPVVEETEIAEECCKFSGRGLNCRTAVTPAAVGDESAAAGTTFDTVVVAGDA